MQRNAPPINNNRLLRLSLYVKASKQKLEGEASGNSTLSTVKEPLLTTHCSLLLASQKCPFGVVQTCRENLHVFVRNGNYSHRAENTLDGAFSGDCFYV